MPDLPFTPALDHEAWDRSGATLFADCGAPVLKLEPGRPGFVKVTTTRGVFELPMGDHPAKGDLQ